MRPFSPAGMRRPDLAQEVLRGEAQAAPLLQHLASGSRHAVVEAAERDAPVGVVQVGDDPREDADRVLRAAAEQAGMQVPVGAAHDDLLIDHAAQRRRDHGRVLVPHAGVADQHDVGLQFGLVGLHEFRQVLGAVLLRALDQEGDADRQRAGDGLPGPAGLEEGHHLAFVVAGAARDDDLAAVRQRGEPRLEGRRLPQVERIDRLDVVMAVEQHMRLARLGAWPEHDGVPGGRPQPRVETERASSAASHSAARAALRRIGRSVEMEGMRRKANSRSSDASRSPSIWARTASSWDMGTHSRFRRRRAYQGERGWQGSNLPQPRIYGHNRRLVSITDHGQTAPQHPDALRRSGAEASPCAGARWIALRSEVHGRPYTYLCGTARGRPHQALSGAEGRAGDVGPPARIRRGRGTGEPAPRPGAPAEIFGLPGPTTAVGRVLEVNSRATDCSTTAPCSSARWRPVHGRARGADVAAARHGDPGRGPRDRDAGACGRSVVARRRHPEAAVEAERPSLETLLQRADPTFRGAPHLSKAAPPAHSRPQRADGRGARAAPAAERPDAGSHQAAAGGGLPLQQLDWLIAHPVAAVALHGAAFASAFPSPRATPSTS